MATIKDISDYFLNLAIQHKSIVHAESAGNRAYEVIAYDQAFSDFRTGGREKAYFVRFILPTVSFRDRGNGAEKWYQVGLMFGKYYSQKEASKTAQLEAFRDAEKVADDFISRMIFDSRRNAPSGLFSSTIDRVERIGLNGDYLDYQGDGSYAAVMYMFDIGTFKCIGDSSDVNSTNWLDL